MTQKCTLKESVFGGRSRSGSDPKVRCHSATTTRSQLPNMTSSMGHPSDWTGLYAYINPISTTPIVSLNVINISIYSMSMPVLWGVWAWTMPDLPNRIARWKQFFLIRRPPRQERAPACLRGGCRLGRFAFVAEVRTLSQAGRLRKAVEDRNIYISK